MNEDYFMMRLPQVLQARGRNQSSHYEDIRNGLFTHPVSLGGRSVGWPHHEVVAINKARIAGKTETEIMALVKELEEMRKTPVAA